MLLGGLIIVYMLHMLFLSESYYLFVTPVVLLTFSLLSASCVCPAQVAFYILLDFFFLSMGK